MRQENSDTDVKDKVCQRQEKSCCSGERKTQKDKREVILLLEGSRLSETKEKWSCC